MKLTSMFDQYPHHTFDKIAEKHITTKKRSPSLTLSSKVKVIAENDRNDLGNEKHATQKKFELEVP